MCVREKERERARKQEKTLETRSEFKIAAHTITSVYVCMQLRAAFLSFENLKSRLTKLFIFLSPSLSVFVSSHKNFASSKVLQTAIDCTCGGRCLHTSPNNCLKLHLRSVLLHFPPPPPSFFPHFALNKRAKGSSTWVKQANDEEKAVAKTDVWWKFSCWNRKNKFN